MMRSTERCVVPRLTAGGQGWPVHQAARVLLSYYLGNILVCRYIRHRNRARRIRTYVRSVSMSQSHPVARPDGLTGTVNIGPGPVSTQRRVQFAVLLQFAAHAGADRATTSAMCPGTDARDLESALGYLVDQGSLAGPTWHLRPLVALAKDGLLSLTAMGQRRLDEDDV